MRTFLKSLFVASLASFSMIAFAGGPTPAEPPAPPPNYAGVYVDLSAGGAFVDWRNFGLGSFNGYNAAVSGVVNSNSRGGFTFGFDVGYRINRFINLEAGWYHLPTVRGLSDVNAALPALKLQSWLAYLGLKFVISLSDQFDLFVKAALGYRSLRHTGNAAIGSVGFGGSETNYFSGVVGAGLQYWFDENWSVSAQYLYMMSRTSGGQVSSRAPGTSLAVGSVAYFFGVV